MGKTKLFISPDNIRSVSLKSFIVIHLLFDSYLRERVEFKGFENKINCHLPFANPKI